MHVIELHTILNLQIFLKKFKSIDFLFGLQNETSKSHFNKHFIF